MKKEWEPSDDHPLIARMETLQWLEGVLEQGAWLLNHWEISVEAPRDQRMALSRAIGRHQHYFLAALSHSLLWAERAVEVDAQLETAVAAYKQANPHAKDMRDMRVHELAYLYPDPSRRDRKPFKPGEYVVEWDVPGLGMVSLDAGSTWIQPGRYQLGGRVDVRSAMAAARALLEVIQARLWD